MRSVNKILLSSFTILGMGIAALLASKGNNQVLKADAARDSAISGIYKLVTDPSDIKNGDEIALVSSDGNALCDIGGNPGYLYTTTDNVYIESDKKLVAFDNANVTIFTAETNTVNYNDEQITVYAFRGDYWINKRVRATGYMAYDYRGSNSSNPGSPTIGGVGYFSGGFGVRPNSERNLAECWWRLHYVTEAGVMDILNYSTGGHVCYGRDRWSGYFHFSDWSNVNLYKYYEVAHVVADASELEKTSYNEGEKFELSGLEVDITFSDSSKVTVEYDKMPGLFNHSEYVTGSSGQVNQLVSIVGSSEVFNIPVNITPSWTKYYVVTSHLADYRGTYALGALNPYYNPEDEYDYSAVAMNAHTGAAISSVNDNDGVLIFDQSKDASNAKVYLDYINNAYRLYYLDDIYNKPVYLGYDTDSEYLTSETLNANNALEVVYDESSHHSFLKVKGTNNYFEASGYRFYLYQVGLSNDDYEDLESFKSELINATKTCDAFNNDFEITSSDWEALEELYATFSIDLKGYLGSVTYVHDDSEHNTELENLIDRYDYIVSKYSSTYNYITDFLSRSGIMQELQPQYHGYLPNFITEASSSQIIIVAVLTISIGVITTVVFLKKRKHN